RRWRRRRWRRDVERARRRRPRDRRRRTRRRRDGAGAPAAAVGDERSSMIRGVARAARALLVVAAGPGIDLALLGPPAGIASAHAVLDEIVPADGQTVDRAPSEVTLRFSEPVSLTGGNARVLNDAGDVVSGEADVVDTTVTVRLPGDLDDGTYVVA